MVAEIWTNILTAAAIGVLGWLAVKFTPVGHSVKEWVVKRPWAIASISSIVTAVIVSVAIVNILVPKMLTDGFVLKANDKFLMDVGNSVALQAEVQGTALNNLVATQWKIEFH